MAAFQFNIDLKNNAYIEINRDTVKYWTGTGLPVYEGGFAGLEKMYPSVIEELIEMNIIQRT